MDTRVEQLLKNILKIQCETKGVLMNLTNNNNTGITTSTLSGQIPALTLYDNSEENINVAVTGYDITKSHTQPTIVTNISSFNIEINFHSLGINNVLKVTIKNNSGVTYTLPVINFTILQLN